MKIQDTRYKDTNKSQISRTKRFRILNLVIVSCLFLVAWLLFLVPVFAQQNSPTLEIISPTDGVAYEEGQELTLSYRTNNFTFVDFKNNREPFPGNSNAGHAHFWVVPADFEGELNHDDAKKLLQDSRPEPFTLEGSGKYKVVVELAKNHHVPYESPVRAEATFRIGEESAGFELLNAVQSALPIYRYSAIGLFLLLVAYAGFKVYKKFNYKKKVDTANEGLPKSDPGGQKTTESQAQEHKIPPSLK